EIGPALERDPHAAGRRDRAAAGDPIAAPDLDPIVDASDLGLDPSPSAREHRVRAAKLDLGLDRPALPAKRQAAQARAPAGDRPQPPSACHGEYRSASSRSPSRAARREASATAAARIASSGIDSGAGHSRDSMVPV